MEYLTRILQTDPIPKRSNITLPGLHRLSIGILAPGYDTSEVVLIWAAPPRARRRIARSPDPIRFLIYEIGLKSPSHALQQASQLFFADVNGFLFRRDSLPHEPIMLPAHHEAF